MLANAVSRTRSGVLALIAGAALTLSQAYGAPQVSKEAPFTVAILLFDDVQIIDFSAPYEVFGHADFEVFTVSKSGKTITTAMGLSVNPSYSFAAMPRADAILVPGGDVGETMHDADTLAWLREQQAQTEHILSVCTGSHIVAESGLLNGLSATTFHNALDGFAETYPAINVAPHKRFVDNGQIITSAGLSSGIDASLHLVSKVLGLQKAKSIALHIEYDWDPDGNFVRAMMADRHLPNNDYDWPEGILFDRLSSVGDMTQWQMVYSARTDAPATRLRQSYADAMAKHTDWQKLDARSETRMRWQGIGENAGWQNTFSVTSADEQGLYYLTLSVQRSQDTPDS